jgi:hypothetical protein
LSRDPVTWSNNKPDTNLLLVATLVDDGVTATGEYHFLLLALSVIKRELQDGPITHYETVSKSTDKQSDSDWSSRFLTVRQEVVNATMCRRLDRFAASW